MSDQKRRSKIKSSDVSLPVNTAVFDALIRCEVRVLSQNDHARNCFLLEELPIGGLDASFWRRRLT
jgi:hypothetical protein